MPAAHARTQACRSNRLTCQLYGLRCKPNHHKALRTSSAMPFVSGASSLSPPPNMLSASSSESSRSRSRRRARTARAVSRPWRAAAAARSACSSWPGRAPLAVPSAAVLDTDGAELCVGAPPGFCTHRAASVTVAHGHQAKRSSLALACAQTIRASAARVRRNHASEVLGAGTT